ncbi:MAG TPA: bifunctional DedA family/phosphatase PAP2 family protein [Solirubrobacterales bacterium]|nr:bifunctional DedA family/phosphatase PAP2 family protein [Solirubrobacterales bacterium]
MTPRRISWKWVRRGLLAAAIVAFFLFRGDLPHIDLEGAIQDLSKGLGAWTYLLVGALAFLETGAFVGLIAPGEFTVMLGGAVAGQGDISLPLILAITWLCAFAGDTVSFMLGARLGRDFLVKHGQRFRITDERLKQVEGYFARYGGRTILIGRFIGLVRALAPFIAGSSKLPYRNFAPFSILGTGLWSTGLILVGYFFAQSLDTVTKVVGKGLFVFAIVIGIVVALFLAYRFLREPENRGRVAAEMEKRPALRPVLALARRLRPQFAFLGRRLTPGGLGLELTTLLAALSVGLFVLIAYWSVIGGNPGPTPGDRTAYDFAHDLQATWLTHIEKVVTELGSGWVTYPLATLVAIVLAVRGYWKEFWALVIGTLLIAVLVPDIKGWTDRPRPPDPITPVGGSAFPSGHSAQGTLYTWLAITFALRVVPGLTRRSLMIAAGIMLTVLIGLSRIYLRVHWMSDVSSGWALGVSCYAGAAAAVLVIDYIRHNPRRHDRAHQLDPGAGAGAGH